MKIKKKNLRKYKNKKFFFFKSKLEQEIKIRKNPKILTKNLSLFDRFSLTHSGGSSVPLGTIINSSQLVTLSSSLFTMFICASERMKILHFAFPDPDVFLLIIR